MSTKTTEDNKSPHPARAQKDVEERVDDDVENTFPASDAAATSGVTKISNDGQEIGGTRDDKVS